jgi:hypothetical protein
MGAFGGTVGGDMTKINCYSSFEGTVTLNPSLVTFTRNGFRLQRLMTGLIIPENGDLDYCESAGLMGAGVTELTIPEHISTIITSFISEFQTMDENHNIQKITIEGDNFRPLFPEKTGSVGWFRNGTGKGRLYVKNEALRQRYINDSE